MIEDYAGRRQGPVAIRGLPRGRPPSADELVEAPVATGTLG